MIRLNIFILAIICVIALPFSSVAQNLGAYPTTLDFKLANGQSEAQVVNITNSSKAKVQFRLYFNDWIRDSLGGHEYYEPNTIPRSASRWVTVNRNFIELEPGQSTTVTVKMAVPDSAEAANEMKWSMLFIETVQEQTAAASKTPQTSVRNLLRIGVHIYQTPPTLTKKEVKIYDLKPAVDTTPNAYNLVCQNTGEIMLECKSYLEVTSLADGKKTKVEALEFPMFPDQRRLVRYELPKSLAKGKYSVLGVIDGGEDLSLEAIESTVEVQ